MVTMAGKSPDLSKLIKSLSELEYDAIAAYRAAIERFENPRYKNQLESFVQDHEQHLSALKQCAQGMSDEVVDGPDMKVALTKGKIVIADIMGDTAILKAMKTNEDDTVMAYEQACQHPNLPEAVRQLCQTGLADEQRHRAWMEQEIETSQQRKAA
jgi:rubrerythrin